MNVLFNALKGCIKMNKQELVILSVHPIILMFQPENVLLLVDLEDLEMNLEKIAIKYGKKKNNNIFKKFLIYLKKIYFLKHYNLIILVLALDFLIW